MKQRACYYSKHQNTAKFKKKKTRNKASPKSQKFTRHNKTMHEPGRGEHGSLRCPPSQVGWGRSFTGARPRDGGSGRAEQPTLPAVPCPRSRPTHPRRAAQAPQPPPRPPLAATCAPGGAAEAARQRPPPLFPAGPARTPPASRRRAAALTWQPRPRRSRYARPGPPAPRSRGRKHKGGRAVPAPGAGGGGSASLTRRGAPGALPPPLLQVPLPPRGGREGRQGRSSGGCPAGGGAGGQRPPFPPSLPHSPHGAHSSLGPPGLRSDFTPPPVPAADVAPAAALPAGARRPRPSARRGPSAAGGRRRSRPLPAPGVPGPAGPRLLRLLRRRRARSRRGTAPPGGLRRPGSTLVEPAGAGSPSYPGDGLGGAGPQEVEEGAGWWQGWGEQGRGAGVAVADRDALECRLLRGARLGWGASRPRGPGEEMAPWGTLPVPVAQRGGCRSSLQHSPTRSCTQSSASGVLWSHDTNPKDLGLC